MALGGGATGRGVTSRPARPARKPAQARPGGPALPPWLHVHGGPDIAGSPRVLAAAWAVVAAVGLTLLWLALRFHRVGDYLTESDFYGGYAQGAALIRHGRLDPARYQVVGPVYDLLLALTGSIVRDLFTAGKLISVAAGCGTLASWLLLLKRRADAAAGLAAVVLLAANAQFVRYGFSATTDMLALGLQAACLCALLGARGRWAPLVSGALAGLATLTRYNAAVLLPAGLACIAWPGAVAGTSRRRVALLFVCGFALVSGPWLAWSIGHGQVPGAMLVRNFAYYATPDAARNTQDLPGDLGTPDAPEVSLGDLVQRDGGALAVRSLRAIPEHLASDAGELLGWPVAILCLLGVPFLLQEPRLRTLKPLVIPWAALFLALVPVFYSPRYSLPLAPFYLALAAIAIASPRYTFAVGAARVPLKWITALVPLGFTVLTNVSLQRQLESQTPVEVVEAGAALRAAAPPGARVVSRKGHIGYYSGLEIAPFPRLQKLSDLAEHCRRSHADFLYFSWLEVQLRPDFSYLLDTTSEVPGLTVVHTTDRQASVVYRIGPEFGRDPAWFGDPLLSQVHWQRVLVRSLPGPLAAPQRNLLAAYALDQGRPAEALDQAQRATVEAPRDTMAWVLTGEALRRLGRFEEAERAFRAALVLDPDETRSRIALGWIQLRAGREGQAAATWRPAIAMAGDDSTLAAMRALYGKLGDREAAQAVEAAAGAKRATTPVPAARAGMRR